MDNFDLIATNLYLALAMGEIATPLHDLKYKKQYIEQPIHPKNGNSFPPDVILFSKTYHHTLLLEIKNTTTSDFNDSQADNYTKVEPDHFKIVFTGYRELNRLKIDFAYKAHNQNEAHLVRGIAETGLDLPLLILDVEKLELRHSEKTKRFDFDRLENVFEKPLKLPIKSVDDIPQLIHFTPDTDNYQVLAYVITSLIALTKSESDAISILDLAKKSYSKLKIWDELDVRFKERLIKKVERILIDSKNYGLDDYVNYSPQTKKVSIDIFDSSGQKAQAKLAAIQTRLKTPEAVIGSGQTALGV